MAGGSEVCSEDDAGESGALMGTGVGGAFLGAAGSSGRTGNCIGVWGGACSGSGGLRAGSGTLDLDLAAAAVRS